VPTILSVATSELSLSIRKPDAERLRWANTILDSPESQGPHRWSRIYAREALHLSRYPNQLDIPLQAIRIGEIGIAAAPCEVFAETGLAIKRTSPLRHTMVIELANGYTGYLPTRQQHEWGGYETWPARSSLLEVMAESKISAELWELLGETSLDSAFQGKSLKSKTNE